MPSNSTWTRWTRYPRKKEGENHDQPSTVHAERRHHRSDQEKRRQLDARPRPRLQAATCQSLEGAHRSQRAPAMGSVRLRPKPRQTRHRHTQDRRSATAPRERDQSDARRRAQGSRVQLGRTGHPLGARAAWIGYAPHALAQYRPQIHRDGRRRLARLLRCAGSAARWPPCRAHGRTRRDEERRLAANERRVRQTVRRREPSLGRRLASLSDHMKKTAPAKGESPSKLIDGRIKELADWRGKTLARVRALIKQADPKVVEEWKWRGVPTWSDDGIICTGETYKSVVKLTFAKGASLKDPSRLFNSSLEGNTRRAIDLHEGDELNADAFKKLIRAAVALNRS